MLAGVAELCAGLASAVASMGADPALLGDLLPAGSLTALLAACPTPAAGRAVMGMAAALPFLPGAQDVRIRCAIKLGSGACLLNIWRDSQSTMISISSRDGAPATAASCASSTARDVRHGRQPAVMQLDLCQRRCPPFHTDRFGHI